MNRRFFVKQSALASLTTFLPSYLLANQLSKHTDFKGKVLIVGAGAAGLYAGYLLKTKGIDYTILEASNKIGGRLGKLENFADFSLDTGAQWLHGKQSILGKLIQQSKTKFTKDNSDEFYWYKNKIRRKLPKNIQSIFGSREDLPDVSYTEYATQKGFDENYQYIVEQIAGDQGASANQLSVKWNALEEENWNSGENDFKFEQTFYDFWEQQIISSIKDSILLNTIVKKIDYRQEQITLTDQNNKTFVADKVILTVPITILQDAVIDFIPSLPTEKVAAFNKIGMGAGMKVFLKFDTAFYKENLIGGKICAMYADESIGKKGKDAVLLAFVMGKQAEYLASLKDEASIIAALLKELDEIYNHQASSSFVKAHIENWTANPFIKGAYSFSKVGIGNARTIAATTIDNKLFFAGEAMHLNGHHQTVHGAMETGMQAVLKILKLKK